MTKDEETINLTNLSLEKCIGITTTFFLLIRTLEPKYRFRQWIRVKTISNFPGKFPKNFDFSTGNSIKEISIFLAKIYE